VLLERCKLKREKDMRERTEKRSDSGSPHFSGVGFAKKERCVLSCVKEIARRVFYHIVCQVGYCIAHCNGAYAEDYRWLLHKNQLNMKEMILRDLGMFTELETFWRWSRKPNNMSYPPGNTEENRTIGSG
jgi:hypothetical protein